MVLVCVDSLRTILFLLDKKRRSFTYDPEAVLAGIHDDLLQYGGVQLLTN